MQHQPFYTEPSPLCPRWLFFFREWRLSKNRLHPLHRLSREPVLTPARRGAPLCLPSCQPPCHPAFCPPAILLGQRYGESWGTDNPTRARTSRSCAPPPPVPGGAGGSALFLLQAGFHLPDNPSSHSFVTNFTAAARSRGCRSAEIKGPRSPAPRAGGQTPPPFPPQGAPLSQAAMLLTLASPAQDPGGGRTRMQMQSRSAQPAPSCCQHKPVCPLAGSEREALPGKGSCSSTTSAFVFLSQVASPQKHASHQNDAAGQSSAALPNLRAGDGSGTGDTNGRSRQVPLLQLPLPLRHGCRTLPQNQPQLLI